MFSMQLLIKSLVSTNFQPRAADSIPIQKPITDWLMADARRDDNPSIDCLKNSFETVMMMVVMVAGMASMKVMG